MDVIPAKSIEYEITQELKSNPYVRVTFKLENREIEILFKKHSKVSFLLRSKLSGVSINDYIIEISKDGKNWSETFDMYLGKFLKVKFEHDNHS